MENKQLPAMWKLFLSIMASGAVMGVVYPIMFRGLAMAGLGMGAMLGLSIFAGLVYAFVMYIFVKSMLRAFVRKLHTLERVVAGITPPELPTVWVSNEIDEVERSAARIIAKLDATRAEAES
jgi:hypothetical protein